MGVTKKDNGKYEARYRDGVGKWRRKTFDKKGDADKFMVTVSHHALSGDGVDVGRNKQPFRVFAEEWYASQPKTENYRTNVRSHLDNHILPAFGERPIGQIGEREVQAFVSRSPLVPTSVRTMFCTLRAILNAARRERIRRDNPCEFVTLPAIPKKKHQPARVDQVHRVKRKMFPRYQAAVVFSAATGVRPGELFGIRVGDIDWTPGSAKLRVRRQVQSYTGRPQEIIENPKDKDDREVALDDALVPILEEHMREFPPVDGFIFTNTEGRPLHRRVFDRAWLRARRAVAAEIRAEAEEKLAEDSIGYAKAVAEAEFIEKLKYYGLRHFYASLLIDDGASPKLVAEQMGHSHESLTLSRYTHLWEHDASKVRAATKKFLVAD